MRRLPGPARGRGSGPYPVMTRAELRAGAGLDLLPSWAMEPEAAANRQLIAAMRQRLAAGEQVARMHQEPGLAGWSGKPRWPKS